MALPPCPTLRDVSAAAAGRHAPSPTNAKRPSSFPELAEPLGVLPGQHSRGNAARGLAASVEAPSAPVVATIELPSLLDSLWKTTTAAPLPWLLCISRSGIALPG